MATSLVHLDLLDHTPIEHTLIERTRSHHSMGLRAVTVLTALAVLIHGYHPYAEDGGLYLAGIKRLLAPQLYPYAPGFVTAQVHLSLFAPMVTMLVRVLAINLMTVMLLLYTASIWATLFAAWQIATRCFRSVEASLGAVSLLALWLTLPIAGTSLMLMDPYVSARSISTPLGLVAIAFALDAIREINLHGSASRRTVALCAGTLLLATLAHPLMGGYAVGFVLLLLGMASDDARLRLAASLGWCLMAVLLAGTLYLVGSSQIAGYADVAQTRSYWFIDRWRWFELAGLLAPLAILAAIGIPRNARSSSDAQTLTRASIVAGLTGLIVATLLARATSASFVVARLQPLRIFQTVYIVMILVLGASFAKLVLKRSTPRWLALFVVLGGVSFAVQRQTFPNSAHLEFPWRAPQNGWEQAFEWIKVHTPADAVFAMDAHYVTEGGEDAQNFRAIAERSALPDYSKDGGIASIAPSLTAQWIQGQTAQTGLESATDLDRIARLRPTSARWMVLSRHAVTSFPCLYSNATVEVCRVPEDDVPSLARR